MNTWENNIKIEDDCWLFQGAKTAAGYSVVRNTETKKNEYVHKLSYQKYISTVLPKLIRHKCRNRHCCNPNHLEGGTHKENNGIDRERDKTDNKGERHGNHKLTEAQVIEMRQLRREGYSIESLMTRYNIPAHQTILNALNGTNWFHIPNPITKEEEKQLRHHKPSKLEQYKEEIIQKRKEGITITRLAQDYNVNPRTITRLFKD